MYDESLYSYRLGRGYSGALTVEFGDRLETKKMESARTRIILRIIVYCLKILTRWLQ